MLLVGVLWILVMAYVCYRGIEVSAMSQKVLLSIEITMLAVFSAVALIKVATGNAPAGHLTPQWSWFNPFHVGSFSLLFRVPRQVLRLALLCQVGSPFAGFSACKPLGPGRRW